jgi:pyruvate/2-oxoglutarate dehydrogenase complex dihydrolipoamide acyltransferase (E2) component
VDLDLTKLLKFREEMNNDKKNISVLDILVKASAMAIKQVPDVNGKFYFIILYFIIYYIYIYLYLIQLYYNNNRIMDGYIC